MNNSAIPLNAMSVGRYAEVKSLEGGEIMCKRLMELGLNKGSLLEIVQNDIGPLIIGLGETRFAIGRSMAQKVMVIEA